jgi:hypothetical protein
VVGTSLGRELDFPNRKQIANNVALICHSTLVLDALGVIACLTFLFNPVAGLLRTSHVPGRGTTKKL